jgi:hypothetical protein
MKKNSTGAGTHMYWLVLQRTVWRFSKLTSNCWGVALIIEFCTCSKIMNQSDETSHSFPPQSQGPKYKIVDLTQTSHSTACYDVATQPLRGTAGFQRMTGVILHKAKQLVYFFYVIV